MFSFFKSKKPSPDHTPSEAIPGPIPPAPKEDDFIFVERKGSTPSPSGSGGMANDSPSRSLYPSIPAGIPGGAAAAVTPVRQHSEEKAGHHVLHGVPFKLSPELAKDSSHWEVTQFHANETLSFITKSAAVRVEYDFSLERGVLYDG
ncbi:uncharacterized protein LOC109410141 [Aedes albopictus]|uniref:UMA domain-containing protein n=1 Tax=Aedes albopictus TaxID=7160 RepID=A0ABM1XKW0_AEDAL|nr:uncharacterized protein LOC109410141 [Aedes albopictus]KXJ68269.1 hypothetical protein RP20_CCG004653 [Aedes albopictus]